MNFNGFIFPYKNIWQQTAVAQVASAILDGRIKTNADVL